MPAEGLRTALQAHEESLIRGALRQSGGNRAAAAKLLRVPLRTLFRRLHDFGIKDEQGAGPEDRDPG